MIDWRFFDRNILRTPELEESGIEGLKTAWNDMLIIMDDIPYIESNAK